MNNQPEQVIQGDIQEHYKHERFRSLLPAFAMICLEGCTNDPEWDALEVHLDGCVECREELEELLELLNDTYAGTLETEAERLIPDITYMPPWATAKEQVDLIAIVHTVTASIYKVFIQFTDMLTTAMQQPNPAGGYRSGEQPSHENQQGLPQEYSYRLQGSYSENVVVAVDFALADSDRQLYCVHITVVDKQQDPFSQDGHHVTVQYEANTRTVVTDGSGCASFNDIPYSSLPELQITISVRPPI